MKVLGAQKPNTGYLSFSRRTLIIEWSIKHLATIFYLLAIVPFTRSAGLPSEPIHPATNYVQQTYILDNGIVTMHIIPALGRITHLSLNGSSNLLHVTELEHTETSEWTNHGGIWTFPIAQNRWTELQATDWPPGPALTPHETEGTAWKNSDGSSSCRLTKTYPAPLNIIFSQTISLHQSLPQIDLTTQLTATSNTPIPYCTWTLIQIPLPDIIAFPVDNTSSYDEGYRLMNGAPAAPVGPQSCTNIFTYAPKPNDELKWCSDSNQHWWRRPIPEPPTPPPIAHQKPDEFFPSEHVP